MKIVRNGFIPFKGFTAINLFGILFVRDDSFLDGIAINHELIHTQQMRELLYIPFYACYVVEWLVRLVYPVMHTETSVLSGRLLLVRPTFRIRDTESRTHG